jgi:hypothetical protein
MVDMNREKRYLEYTLADENDNLLERVTQRTCEEDVRRSTGFLSFRGHWQLILDVVIVLSFFY